MYFSLSSKHLRNIFFFIFNFIQICSNSSSIILFHQIFINFLLFLSISFVFFHFSSILFNFNPFYLSFVYFQLFLSRFCLISQNCPQFCLISLKYYNFVQFGSLQKYRICLLSRAYIVNVSYQKYLSCSTLVRLSL